MQVVGKISSTLVFSTHIYSSINTAGRDTHIDTRGRIRVSAD